MKNDKKIIIQIPYMVVAYVFMLMIYAPMELYLVNIDEYRFDIYLLFPVLLVFAVVAAVLFGMALLAVSSISVNMAKICWTFLFALFVYFYLQGNLLSFKLPVFDGETIDWSVYRVERYISIAVLISVLLICFVLYKKFEKAFFHYSKLVLMLVTLMLVLSLVTLLIGQNGFRHKVNNLIMTDKNELTMSDDENFIVIILDTVDAGTFGEILEDDIELKDNFKDFTFYPDTMGGYPLTHTSMPFIISGEWYEGLQDYNEYSKNAYNHSKVLNYFYENDYVIGMYETDMLEWEDVIPDNLAKGHWQYFSLEKEWLRLVFFRYMPYQLKPLFVQQFDAFDNIIKSSIENKEIVFGDSNKILYDKLDNEDVTVENEKYFKWIHLNGAHPPFAYDRDFQRIPGDGVTYEESVRSSISLVNKYLDELKEAHVYDNSVIIIMADHGYLNMRQNPLLMIKGKDEHHEFMISEHPVSYEDMAETFIQMEQGASGNAVFELISNHPEGRRYFDSLGEEYEEYIQMGKAWDTSTMYKTGWSFK
ncbi:MAG: sulfatase-like hydrolase/transferase [Lachnospiraceae bacterium]